MNGTAINLSSVPRLANPLRAGLAELRRREPVLANLSLVFAIAILSCLVAMQVDPRTVNDVSVWVKPAKFLASFAVFFATLAWFFGALPGDARSTRSGRYVIGAAAAAGIFEMVWLVSAAVSGVPAHFNRASLFWGVAYSLGGVGALTLLSAMVVQGRMIARDRAVELAPAMRRAIVLGAYLGAALTLVTAGYLSTRSGHWVGGTPSDAGGLPLVGWSRSGGDLRVAHFFALHQMQFLPLVAWVALRAIPRHALAVVHIAALLGVVATAFVFVQALSGLPLFG